MGHHGSQQLLPSAQQGQEPFLTCMRARQLELSWRLVCILKDAISRYTLVQAPSPSIMTNRPFMSVQNQV